jgi:hypothetical protein
MILRTNIDATFKGNISRFLNHSCDPNLSLVLVHFSLFSHFFVFIGSNVTSSFTIKQTKYHTLSHTHTQFSHVFHETVQGIILIFFMKVRINSFVPHVAFFANRDIHTGEELTFHYGVHNTQHHKQTITQQNQKNFEHFKQLRLCYCGSQNCCGFLPFDPTV